MNRKHGVLLVNLGTPDSPRTKDVRRYLGEFLSDPRVLDINPLLRAFIVNAIIKPFRSPKSAATYREIWTENGSPLLHYGERLQSMVQERLGDEYVVELAMRYQNPSIPSVLERMRRQQLNSLTVFSLFPQYASCTVGSVHQRVMEELTKWETIPDVRFVTQYHDNEKMVRAFAENGRAHNPERFDHVLFSFHGIPQRQLLKGDDSGSHCLQSENCCQSLTFKNKLCYSAQCHSTARNIARAMGLPEEKYTVTFQSRLGNDPWTQPYTSKYLQQLAEQGKRRVLVFCPAFVADCLETLYEIAVENDEDFREVGGEKVELVESLNDSPLWADAVAELVQEARPAAQIELGEPA